MKKPSAITQYFNKVFANIMIIAPLPSSVSVSVGSNENGTYQHNTILCIGWAILSSQTQSFTWFTWNRGALHYKSFIVFHIWLCCSGFCRYVAVLIIKTERFHLINSDSVNLPWATIISSTTTTITVCSAVIS